LIAWGTCGHAKASATTQCRVCWCLAFESDIDRTNWDPSHEDEDRRLYNAEADRERAHREWSGREDEANAYQHSANTIDQWAWVDRQDRHHHFHRSPADESRHLELRLQGVATRFGLLRHCPVSGEPYAEYLNPPVQGIPGITITLNGAALAHMPTMEPHNTITLGADWIPLHLESGTVIGCTGVPSITVARSGLYRIQASAGRLLVQQVSDAAV
jgi:hypothetical protein